MTSRARRGPYAVCVPGPVVPVSTDSPFVTFIVLLTVAANAATVALWALAAASLVSAGARRALGPARDELGRSGLALAALVAAIATLSSLWLSEGLGFVPCRLCWFQRTLIYPLAVVLVIAAVRRDWGARPYALALALLAAPVSIYHYVEQAFPDLGAGACDPTAPCSFRWVWELGYISIPWMALSTSVLVITLLGLARPDDPARGASGRDDDEEHAAATAVDGVGASTGRAR